MDVLDIETVVDRSRPVDLAGIAWDDVRRHPLSNDVIRVLTMS